MKAPLMKRLHAWWEGYDLAAIEHARLEQEEAGSATAQNPEETEEIDPNLLDEDRVAFLELLWGKGFCRPGSEAALSIDRKVLTLNPSTTVMELGAGLFAGPRVMAEEHTVYTDGFEDRPLLVDSAENRQKSAEASKHVKFLTLPRGGLPESGAYHRIVINRYLHRLEDPIDALKQVCPRLKEEGLFFMTEYTAGEKGPLSEDVLALMDGFEAPRALIGRDVYCTALEELGLTVRVRENRTQEHLSEITNAWAKLDKHLIEQGPSFDMPRFSAHIAQETDRWGKLAKALTDGYLEYSRILATV